VIPLEFCEFVLVLVDAGLVTEPGEIDRLVESRCWLRPYDWEHDGI
jgi:hypothetical protein